MARPPTEGLPRVCDRLNMTLHGANADLACRAGATYGPYTLYFSTPFARVLCEVRAYPGSAVLLTLCDGPTVAATHPVTGASCFAPPPLTATPAQTAAVPAGLYGSDVLAIDSAGVASPVMGGAFPVAGGVSRAA